MSKLSKNTMNSAWTPLSNDTLNQKSYTTNNSGYSTRTAVKQHPQQAAVHIAAGSTANIDPLRAIFNERRALINKWFDKWGDAQRLAILEDLIARCRVKNLEQASVALSRRKPMLHEDFTRSLPRVLSVYLFSFLDPRSLSRCAQVCWHWKSITELDELWMRKCLHLGWSLPYAPSPLESGTWKRLYIERIVALKSLMPHGGRNSALSLRGLGTPRGSEYGDLNSSRSRANQSSRRPPWKGTDPVPKDIWRNNYLDNDDEITKVTKILKKNMQLNTDAINRRTQIRLNSARRTSARRSASLTRSQSLQMLNDDSLEIGRLNADDKQTNHKPRNNISHVTSDRPSSRNQSRQSKPPRPTSSTNQMIPSTTTADVKTSAAVPSVLADRTYRDPPSVDLFPSQPWTIPAPHSSDDDDDDDDDVRDFGDEIIDDNEVLDSNVY